MGCDIHIWAEVKNSEGKWNRVEEAIFREYGNRKTTEPFGWRSYGMFAFLADVRNYSKIKCIRQPRGLPNDSEYLNRQSKYAYENNPMTGELIPLKDRQTNKKDLEEDYNYHSLHHLYLKELVDFNYEVIIEDRRGTVQTGPNSWNGAGDLGEGNGTIETMREFLGSSFFEHLDTLKSLGEPENVRIVFYFDN